MEIAWLVGSCFKGIRLSIYAPVRLDDQQYKYSYEETQLNEVQIRLREHIFRVEVGTLYFAKRTMGYN